MKILVTGAKGFVGKNLCAQLNNIKEGKAKCYGDVTVSEVYEYDIDSTPEELDSYCRDCDFVFNLAGVNRPQTPEEFMQGNFGFASLLLDTLKKYNRPMVCTEYMARTQNSTFQTIMPMLRKENVGAINWGFVAGKYQTYEPWEKTWLLYESGENTNVDFTKWFHDLYRPNHRPYDPKEIELIRYFCDLADRK